MTFIIGSSPQCAAGCSWYSAYTYYPDFWSPVSKWDTGSPSGIYYNVPWGNNTYYLTSSFYAEGSSWGQVGSGEMTMTWYPPAP